MILDNFFRVTKNEMLNEESKFTSPCMVVLDEPGDVNNGNVFTYDKKNAVGTYGRFILFGDSESTSSEGQVTVGNSKWGRIEGDIEDQTDLIALVDTKQTKLKAGSNITITSEGNLVRISASGTISGTVDFIDILGEPSDNLKLNAVLDSKADKADAITTSELEIKLVNYVTNSELGKYVTTSELENYVTTSELEDYVTDSELGDGVLTLKVNGTKKLEFSANRKTDAEVDIISGGTGVITFKQNDSEIGQFCLSDSEDMIINIKVPTFHFDPATGILSITDR